MKFPSGKAGYSLFFTTILLLVSASCKKSSGSNAAAGGSMSATISGNGWAANYLVQAQYSSLAGIYDVAGLQVKDADTTTLFVSISAPIIVNQAVSSDTAEIAVDYVDKKSNIEYDGGNVGGVGGTAGHAIVTVTAFDTVSNTLGGTFSGVLYNISGGSDSLVVTGGAFRTTYVKQ